jgi:DNA-binding CsgD family transcriptional regulator
MTNAEIYQKTQMIWLDPDNKPIHSENFINVFKSLPLAFLTENNHTVLAVFNLLQFKPESFSKNAVEVLGETPDKILELGTNFFLEHFHETQKTLPLIASKWIKENLVQTPFDDKVNIRNSLCGILFNHKTKGAIRLLIQHYLYDNDENRNPIRVLATFSDVSHLLKNDVLWFRTSYGDKSQYVKTYYFNEQQNNIGDIISSREREILELIVQDLDAVEIGKRLFISHNTVNNHRQNMLNRLGVKDTTALVQLCRTCGII